MFVLMTDLTLQHDTHTTVQVSIIKSTYIQIRLSFRQHTENYDLINQKHTINALVGRSPYDQMLMMAHTNKHLENTDLNDHTSVDTCFVSTKP